MGSNNGRYELKPLREVLTLKYGDNLPKDNRSGEGCPVLGSNGIVGYHSEHSVTGPGIVVGRKGSIGKVTWVASDFWPIDTTYYVEQRSDHDRRWLYYLLKFVGLNRLNSATGIPGLNRDDAYTLKVPLPSPVQSQRIAQVLGSVDDAIERTRAVIAQTRKLKTALLQDLLTNGLPGRHSKFHFVKRLARLPKDWRTSRLNELTPESDDICYGVVQPGEEFRDGVPLVRVCDIEHGGLDPTQLKKIDPTIAAAYKRSQLRGGELLVTLVGTIGRCTIAPRESAGFNIARAVAKVTLKPDVNNRFVMHFLNTVANAALVGDAYESARKTLNLAELSQFPVPVPDRQEQDDIVHLADSIGSCETAENDRLPCLLNTKAALSQALLTGRVRVLTKGER